MSHNRDLSAAAAQIGFNNSNIGIGTDNPSTVLEVRTTTTNAATHYRNNASNGGAYFGVRATDLGAASAGEAYVYSYNSGINLLADGTGDINFATGGTASKVRITSGGSVGININSPDGTLHVHSGSAGSVTANGNADDLIVESSGTGGISILTPDSSTGYLMFGSPTSNEGAIVRYRDSDNFLTIGTEDADGQVVFRSGAGTERLRITSSGIINSNNYSFNSQGTNTASNVYLGAFAPGSSAYAIATNGAERLRINSAGDIGVNTTVPSAKLHVNLTKSSGTTGATRTKQHAAMRLSLDRTTGSMPYQGWGPALDFYSDNYDGSTQRPNARIAGVISNYSLGDEGGELRFYTTPTDTATSESDFAQRMTITSAGYVLKPNTPAFFVYRNQSSWTLAANDVFIFNTAEFNVGGHYSTSNGRFTAPITGRYVFHFFSIYTGNAAGDSIEMYKNSTRMNGGDVHFTNDVGSNWDAVHYSRVIQLSGGDYVHMQTRSGHTFHGNHWGGWSGYMLG